MLLVVNAGSSSVKLAVFDGAQEVARGQVAELGPGSHAAAMVDALAQTGVGLGKITAAAHRIVHGGADLTAPMRLTPAAIAAIEACIPLAPLHNPANLTGIRVLADLAPDLPQYASFEIGRAHV